MSTPSRSARVERKTKESDVLVELTLDGTGTTEVDTGVPFFDHMISQLGKHGGFDLVVRTRGDLEVDAHHTVEDTAIALGQALREALGDKAGIRRFGEATVPLDEALVQTVVDLSGRPFLVYDVTIAHEGPVLKLWELLKGDSRNVHLHVRRFPVLDLPQEDGALAEWVIALFAEKEKLLQSFEETGVFPAASGLFEPHSPKN